MDKVKYFKKEGGDLVKVSLEGNNVTTFLFSISNNEINEFKKKFETEKEADSHFENLVKLSKASKQEIVESEYEELAGKMEEKYKKENSPEKREKERLKEIKESMQKWEAKQEKFEKNLDVKNKIEENIKLEEVGYPIPEELREYLEKIKEIDNSNLYLFDEKFIAQESIEYRNVPVAEEFGFYVLEDTNSNPYCFISKGKLEGKVVHMWHDSDPILAFRSLDDFVTVLKNLDEGEDIESLRDGIKRNENTIEDDKLAREIIEEAIRSEENNLRYHFVIFALSLLQETSEDFLLDLLKDNDLGAKHLSIIGTLQKIGTSKSLEFLQKIEPQLKDGSGVKFSVERAMTEIGIRMKQ